MRPGPVGLPPFGMAAFDRRLDAESPRPVVVAFSGGGDSLALLLAARAWARPYSRPLQAVTVDHGLQPQSLAATERAGEMARALGVAWRSLVWRGPKPVAGLQAAARAARHRLLADHAREIGARVLLFGHTADDRLEADLMRAETPGLGRLREWGPSPAWPQGRGVFLLRPMLKARRDVLRAWLAGQGLAWLDDPANTDPRFARSRARASLQTPNPGGSRPRASCPQSFRPQSSALRNNEGDDPEPDSALGGLARGVSADVYGCLRADRAVFAAGPAHAARRMLGAAVLCASGASRPPRGEALQRLLDRISLSERFTLSLAGARIMADDETVVFARQAGDLARSGVAEAGDRCGSLIDGPAQAAPGPVVFDGRFELWGVEAGWTVAPVAGHASRLSPGDRWGLRRAPGPVRPSLPATLDATGAPSLPAPFGAGLARARALAGRRFAAACGLVAREHDIDGSVDCDMALDASSPYLHP